VTHLDPEVLALFAGGDLPEAEARAAAAHVGECEACSRTVAEMRATLADFRAWAAEDGAPTAEETRKLHDAVLERLPRRRSFGMAAGVAAAAAAAVVICAFVVLRAPWTSGGKQQIARVEAPSTSQPGNAPAAIRPRQSDLKNTTGSATLRKDRLEARSGGGWRSRTPANLYPSQAGAGMRASRHHPAPGMKNVALRHDADGEPMLQIATANPNVVILWYVDEGNKKDDE